MAIHIVLFYMLFLWRNQSLLLCMVILSSRISLFVWTKLFTSSTLTSHVGANVCSIFKFRSSHSPLFIKNYKFQFNGEFHINRMLYGEIVCPSTHGLNPSVYSPSWYFYLLPSPLLHCNFKKANWRRVSFTIKFVLYNPLCL